MAAAAVRSILLQRTVKATAMTIATGSMLGLSTLLVDGWLRLGRFPSDLPALIAIALLLTVLITAWGLPFLVLAARLESFVSRWSCAMVGGVLGGYAVAFVVEVWV